MTDRREIFLPSLPWDIHFKTSKEKTKTCQGASQQIWKRAEFCHSKDFLLIEKLAVPTLKVHSSVLKSDLNAIDAPKWSWGIYLKSHSIKCDLIKDSFLETAHLNPWRAPRANPPLMTVRFKAKLPD